MKLAINTDGPIGNKKRTFSCLINPLWNILFLALIAFIAVSLKLPEEAVLFWVYFYYIVLSVLHPFNCIPFLLLMTPFFLADSKMPYYFHLEVLVYIFLMTSGVFVLVRRKDVRVGPIPFLGVSLIFLASAFLSIPINFKEFYFEIRGSASVSIYKTLIGQMKYFSYAHEGLSIYWLRCLVNTASGFLIYILIVYYLEQEEKERILRNIFKTITVMFLSVMIIAFLLNFKMIPTVNKLYLTFSLAGSYPEDYMMTGFAVNRGYWGQFIISYLPLAGMFACGGRGKKVPIIMAVIALLLGTIAIGFVSQRGAVIALGFEIMIAAVLFIRSYSGNRPRIVLVVFLIFILLGASFASIDHFYLNGQFLKSVKNLMTGADPGLRSQLWRVAGTMFLHNPILGVGFGKYHYFFPQYCLMSGIPASGDIMYSRTHPHNLYLNILSEQGILGLLSFITIIVFVFRRSIKSIDLLNEKERMFSFAILISLAGWLAYGLSQYTFYIRSLQIFFWIMLGLLASLVKPYIQPEKISRRRILLGTALLIVLLSYRLFIVYSYKP